MTLSTGESDRNNRHNTHETAKTEASVAWYSISAYSNFETFYHNIVNVNTEANNIVKIMYSRHT